jgi:dihydroneopterin aldolase
VALHADLADEAAVRALPGQAAQLLGRLDCIVNNASLFEYDSAAKFSPGPAGAPHAEQCGAPLLLAQALHALTPDGGQAVVINLLDQKLYNLNPDFLSYTLSKAALHTATTMLAQALAPKLRVVGVAPGITLVSGDQTEAGFEQAHHGDAAGPLVDAAGHRRRRLLRGLGPRADRHHPAGRRRPAPGAAGARRDVPYDKQMRRKNLHEGFPMLSALTHPQLRDCRRLFLRNYEVMINIGVHDFEKKGEQRVLINVDLYIPLALSTPRHDQLDEVVDYDFMRETIARRMAQGHVHLQETLCDDVVKRHAGAPARARRARVDHEAGRVPRLRRRRRRSIPDQG